MADQLSRYMSELTSALRRVLGESLSHVFVGGSVAMGDFHTTTSDVDIALVLGDSPPQRQLLELAECIDHRVLPCPAKGLDLVGYHGEAIGRSPPRPRALFGFVTGRSWTSELTGAEEDANFLIDLYVLRSRGRCVYGSVPDGVFGSVPEDLLVRQIVDVVAWHRDKIHDPFHDPTGAFAVLNACRAWHFVETGVMKSKTGGGRWAQSRVEQAALIQEALDGRCGSQERVLGRSDVLEFLDVVAAEIALVRSNRKTT